MKITSPAFTEGGSIPKQFTRDGSNKSPALQIEDIPEKAKSLVLIMDDPDAPGGAFAHWLLYNMSPGTKQIREDAPPVMATQGRNDWGDIGYGGPKPQSGEHHYIFKLYALDTVLTLARGIKRSDLEKAIEGRVIDEAELMGSYASSEPVGAR